MPNITTKFSTILEKREVSSLYLHFPFCRHLCNFCDFYKVLSIEGKSDFLPYYDYLEHSMEKLKILMEQKGFKIAPLETFYIGGGTPSLWGCAGPVFLKDFFLRHGLEFRADCEFTIEIDPGVWTPDSIHDWVDFGANRFSIGIQCYDSRKLATLDRHHSWEDSKKILEFFQNEQLNFSVDLLLGIPYSEMSNVNRNIIHEIEKILEFGPKHMSLYFLTVGDEYPFKAFLPEDAFIAEEFLKAVHYLKENGLSQYEVSNYAAPGFESRHNRKYWELKSMMALGQSATGLLVVNEKEATRFKWKASSPDFILEDLRSSECRLEKVYLGLRSNNGLSAKNIFCTEDLICLDSLVIGWEKQGLINSYKDRNIKLSSKGFLMLDSLMNDLFINMKGF